MKAQILIVRLINFRRKMKNNFQTKYTKLYERKYFSQQIIGLRLIFIKELYKKFILNVFFYLLLAHRIFHVYLI